MQDSVSAPLSKLPILKSAPRIRQILYCDFPNGNGKYPNCAVLPEFWKYKRPVLIISPRSKLSGNVMALPLTSKIPYNNPAAYKLKTRITEKDSWVICDYIATVSVARLRQRKKIYYLPQEEFDAVLNLLSHYWPKFPVMDA